MASLKASSLAQEQCMRATMYAEIEAGVRCRSGCPSRREMDKWPLSVVEYLWRIRDERQTFEEGWDDE